MAANFDSKMDKLFDAFYPKEEEPWTDGIEVHAGYLVGDYIAHTHRGMNRDDAWEMSKYQHPQFPVWDATCGKLEAIWMT